MRLNANVRIKAPSKTKTAPSGKPRSKFITTRPASQSRQSPQQNEIPAPVRYLFQFATAVSKNPATIAIV